MDKVMGRESIAEVGGSINIIRLEGGEFEECT